MRRRTVENTVNIDVLPFGSGPLHKYQAPVYSTEPTSRSLFNTNKNISINNEYISKFPTYFVPLRLFLLDSEKRYTNRRNGKYECTISTRLEGVYII